MSAHLIALLQQAFRPRVLVVGDVMLDRYVWGDVERISPEAPIPVLRVGKREHRLGGAGSVASMLVALETETILATVTGDDAEGRSVRELLGNVAVDCRCVLFDPQRLTTVKERLLGRSQGRYPHHMMRVDQEDDRPISPGLFQQLLCLIADRLGEIDLVVASDYNKGVCGGEMIPRLAELAQAAKVPLLADPVRGADYHRYAGCTCITPNRSEAGVAAGMRVATAQDGLEAARRLLHFGVDTVLVTLDRDGIAWADQRGNARLFPCRPRQICDITGAGDMVLSTIGFCLAAGADFPAAIEMANLAGGLEVERLGVVPVSRQDILAELTQGTAAAHPKILSPEQLESQLCRQRLAGRRIVMTNGCFDLLHPGHVASLQQARNQGDLLVVGLNSDESVRQLKGPGRPLIDQQGRAEMLAALACVDYVVIFAETNVTGLIDRLRPDVLVKADQYPIELVVGHEIVARHGGHVVTVPTKPGYSTSGLVEKIRRIPHSKRSAA